MKNQTILVLDFGGQYKELIARSVRRMNVYSVVEPSCISEEKLKDEFQMHFNKISMNKIVLRLFLTSKHKKRPRKQDILLFPWSYIFCRTKCISIHT